MKLSGKGRVRGLCLWFLQVGLTLRLLHFIDASSNVVGEVSMVVQGYWWGLGIGRLVWDCNHAAVALGFARGGVWLQVSCSMSLLPLVDLWHGGGGFLGLCVFHLRVSFLSIPLVAPPLSCVAFLEILFDYYLFTD